MTESLEQTTVVVVGCGNMGSAIVEGLVADGDVPADRVVCADHDGETNRRLAEAFGVRAAPADARPAEAIETAGDRLFVIAVEPDDVEPVLRANRSAFESSDAVVSIAAGVSIEALRSAAGDVPSIVRAMPNAPAAIGAGVTGVFGADERVVDVAAELFEALGESVVLEREADFDALTALSGSGPALVFAILEALADGAVAEGLSRDRAVRLARETLRGAAELAGESDAHTAELKDRVTSPGGTTAEALSVLESEGVRAGLIRAVREAASKSRRMAEDD